MLKFNRFNFFRTDMVPTIRPNDDMLPIKGDAKRRLVIDEEPHVTNTTTGGWAADDDTIE